MPACIEAVETALRSLSAGRANLPLRSVLRLPGGQNAFGVMPAFLEEPRALGAKLVSVFPENHGTARDSHQGAVLLFDADNGALLALLDGSSITAIRTAAVSAVATRELALPDASELALLGSGVQARTHLSAMLAVRNLTGVRVWSRDAANRAAFVEHARRAHGVTVRNCKTAEEAVDGAQIICTVTSSREPVLRGDWLSAGVHINAVGASLPIARELDGYAVARSRLFVDRRESTLNEAGDFLKARTEGLVTDAHILAEIGEVLLGTSGGRETRADITLFKSLGLAVEDLAAANVVYQRAIAEGSGVRVEFGGARPE